MKTIAVMQPYLFPYMGYFQLINAVDTYVLFDDVQHIKRGWIHRNNILVNNSAHRFTVMLDGASTTKRINEIYIKDDFVAFLKTIRQSYTAAPYFDEIMELLANICSYEDKNLARFIEHSLKVIASYIQIETEFVNASEYEIAPNLKGQERILAICEKLSATHYINAIGGQELYDKDKFSEHGIQLNFIETGDITYKQLKDPFVPYLSIIDVMMFNSPIEIKKMLNKYELI